MAKRLSPWMRAYRKVLYRYNAGRKVGLHGRVKYDPVPIDRGVNYFVEALERLGATTMYSCDGHGNPENFYVMFKATYKLALKILHAGYFDVELNSRKDVFAIHLGPAMDHVAVGPNKYRSVKVRGKANISKHWQQTLEWASLAWEKHLFCEEEA